MPRTSSKPAPTPDRAPPVHEIRIGLMKAAIWANATDDGVRHSVTFIRSYKDGEAWKTTHSFGRDDLLVMAKLADQAHSWLVEHGSRKSARSDDLRSGTLPAAGE